MTSKENVHHYALRRPFLQIATRGGGQIVLQVRQATEQGYIECVSGGVFDMAYPTSQLRRARVKDDGRVASALMAGETSQCVFLEYDLD